jgi:hypothetical protein
MLKKFLFFLFVFPLCGRNAFGVGVHYVYYYVYHCLVFCSLLGAWRYIFMLYAYISFHRCNGKWCC